MTKELLAKLRATTSVPVANAPVRTLDDAELNAVVGGMMKLRARTDSCSGGCYDDCLD